MNDTDTRLTELLRDWEASRPDVLSKLMPRIADDLRDLAAHHVRRLGSTPTLQPTAILNEAYIRLANRDGVEFPSRAHFFAFASKLMRDLLVDHLRSRGREKRGAGVEALTLEAADREPRTHGMTPETILAIHLLLAELDRRDPRRAAVVELRFFGGLRMAEIAEVTGRSLASVERDWQVARRWLARELGAGS
ncbi:MAG: ECF-type sigma factor [Acidobacteriota bacterium]